MISTSLEAVTQEPLQRQNENPRSMDERILLELLKMVKTSSKNIQALEDDHVRLVSANKILEEEIVQLKIIHVTELNTTVDSFVSKRNIISEKGRDLIEQLKCFVQLFPNSGIDRDIVAIAQRLFASISRFNYENLREYPTYCGLIENASSQDSAAIVPYANMSVLAQPYPCVMDMMQENFKEIQILEEKVAPIRKENMKLIEKKAMMIDFHSQYLKWLCKDESLRMKDIAVKLSGFSTRKWKFFHTKEVWNPPARVFFWKHDGYMSTVEDETRPKEGHDKLAVIGKYAFSISDMSRKFEY